MGGEEVAAHVELVPAEAVGDEVWERLVQLFLHDMSVFCDDVTFGADGRYRAVWPNLTGGRDRFVIAVASVPKGLVTLQTWTSVRYVSQLFVIPALRGTGLAAVAVESATRRWPGAWAATLVAGNRRARAFWTKYVGSRDGKMFTGYAQWHVHPARVGSTTPR